MDELVRQALAKWPDVPDCTGWLALDARGRWRVGEAGDGPRQPVTHATMNGFIARNYASAGRCWIFQNGPQRVFVELEYTPFVWRLHPRESAIGWNLVAHTGVAMTPSSVWLDDQGRFLFQARSSRGEPVVGVLHDHDTGLVAEALCDRAGHALDDDTLSRLSTGAMPLGTSPPHAEAFLPWRMEDQTLAELPLQRIASHQVPSRFAFDPRPSLSLRIDVDTRR